MVVVLAEYSSLPFFLVVIRNEVDVDINRKCVRVIWLEHVTAESRDGGQVWSGIQNEGDFFL